VRFICIVCLFVCLFFVCLFVCLLVVYGWLIFSPLLPEPQICHHCTFHDDSMYGALLFDDWHM